MPKRYQEDKDSWGLVVGDPKRRKVMCKDDDFRKPSTITPPAMFSNNDYTVAWICALPLEMAAAKGMLDKIHTDLPKHLHDHNIYTLGRIGEHNIVIACLPSGVYGTTSAATVAKWSMTS